MGLWIKFKINKAEKTRQSKFSKQFEKEKKNCIFLPTHMRLIKNKHKKKYLKKVLTKSVFKKC